MKRIVLLISVAAMALFASSTVSAQGKFGPDSAECIKYLSYYTEYYKQKNYDSALPNWRKAYSLCPPTARYSMLSDGTTLLRNLINKNAKNAVYRAKLVDSLMTVYDQRVEFWPKYAISSLNNKALDMYNYMKNDPERLYAGLNDIVAQTKEETRANIFLFQLNTAIDLFREGTVDAEKVIEIYENAIKYLGMMTPKNDTEKATIEKEIKTMPNYFADYDTVVHFISADKMKRDHSGIPHGGVVIRSGKTGLNGENNHIIEYSLKLDSNPEFTASVIVAYARATVRMASEGMTGCKTVFDIAPADLSALPREELLAHLL